MSQSPSALWSEHEPDGAMVRKMILPKSKIIVVLAIALAASLFGPLVPRAFAQTTVDSFTYSPGTTTEQCQTLTGVSEYQNYLASENICFGLSGQAIVDNQESDSAHDFYIFTLTTVAVN